MTWVYEYGARLVLLPSFERVLMKPMGRGIMAEIRSL